MSSSLLKQTEEELRASEARYRTFVDHATDAFMLHGEDGTLIDVNPQACDNLGYSRDELIGMTPMEFDPNVSNDLLENINVWQLAVRSWKLTMDASGSRPTRHEAQFFSSSCHASPLAGGAT
jgi:PAS domain-containing protein